MTEVGYAEVSDYAKAEAVDRDPGEIQRAADALEKRIYEAHDRLAALEDRIGSVLRMDDTRPSESDLTAVSPPRSPLAARLWGTDSEIDRLVRRLVDLCSRVDL